MSKSASPLKAGVFCCFSFMVLTMITRLTAASVSPVKATVLVEDLELGPFMARLRPRFYRCRAVTVDSAYVGEPHATDASSWCGEATGPKRELLWSTVSCVVVASHCSTDGVVVLAPSHASAVLEPPRLLANYDRSARRLLFVAIAVAWSQDGLAEALSRTSRPVGQTISRLECKVENWPAIVVEWKMTSCCDCHR